MLLTILLFIATIVGIVLFIAILALYLHEKKEISVRKFQSKKRGMTDLLVHAAVVDNGIIVCKNGGLMAGWIYRGEDNLSSTDLDKEVIVDRINQALLTRSNGWMIHVDAIRYPSPSYAEKGVSKFPDSISGFVDETRRQFFEKRGTLYEGHYVITLTWLPPSQIERKFVELMFDDNKVVENSFEKTNALIEKFKREISLFSSQLSTALDLERLDAYTVTNEDGSETAYDKFLQYLRFCITGENNPVQLPPIPMYIDSLIGGQDFHTGVIPLLGNKYIQCVSIDGFPTNSTPGMLSALAELNCQYRWSTRFIFLDPQEAIARLEAYRKKWKQKVRGFLEQVFNIHSGNVDEDAMNMVDDASSALAEINAGLVTQGYYTSVVVLMDESRAVLEENVRAIKKYIDNLGFNARIEDVNCVEAYLGSIPGHGVENLRRPILSSLNLSDLIPTSSIWSGENTAPCPLYPSNAPALIYCVTTGSTPFRLNLHVRDLGHTFISGPTRSGKSTLLALIAMQFRRYANSTIYAFDKGMSMYPTCKACGGDHFEISSDASQIAFAPLSDLSTPQIRAWAAEWIESLLVLNKVNVTPAQRNKIGGAIQSLSAKQQENSVTPTLTHFINQVQDEEIRTALDTYSMKGNMGYLFDAKEDNLKMSKFMCFELEELMSRGEMYVLPALLYLFMRIESSLTGDPTLIILDEAWMMLQHPVFKAKIRDWLKSVAKKNAAVILSTQNISDASKSEILDVIIESTATKIFLANPYARTESNLKLYSEMELNDRQVEIIANMVPKRDYYYVSERGRRLFQLAIDKFALAFVGATDPDSIAEIKKLEGAYGPEWPVHWLKEKNIDTTEFEKFREGMK